MCPPPLPQYMHLILAVCLYCLSACSAVVCTVVLCSAGMDVGCCKITCFIVCLFWHVNDWLWPTGGAGSINITGKIACCRRKEWRNERGHNVLFSGCDILTVNQKRMAGIIVICCLMSGTKENTFSSWLSDIDFLYWSIKSPYENKLSYDLSLLHCMLHACMDIQLFV